MAGFRFFIKPAAGECVEASVPLPQPGYALVVGTVTQESGDPVENALVLLLDQDSGALLAHTLSDELGRFYLGPLEGGQLYALRVQKAGGQIRKIELASRDGH